MKLNVVCIVLIIALVLVGCNHTGDIDVPIYDDEVDEIVGEAPTPIAPGEQGSSVVNPPHNEEEPTQIVKELPEQSSWSSDVVAPLLYLNIMPEQRAQAIRTNGFWEIFDDEGYVVHFSEQASPIHAIDRRPYEFDGVTLRIDSASGIIKLEFIDYYLPQSLSVVRWNTKYLAGNYSYSEVWNKRESVEAIEGAIHIASDGYDYIYDLRATWTEGSGQGWAVYTFRTISGSAN